MHKKKLLPLSANLPPEQSDALPQTIIEQLSSLFQAEYGKKSTELEYLLKDVKALYAGNWPEYEACQVGYHNLNHSLAVSLATARMTCGWNKLHPGHTISEETFIAGIAASLLHDSGYLKNKNDHNGKGGKYTFSHVGRSRNLARNYLTKKSWNEHNVEFVCRIIEITEFGSQPDMTIFVDDEQLTMAQMVASADLIAQMADINYIRRLRDLHNEFLEAYDTEGRKKLIQRSIQIYETFDEMLSATPDFYVNFILPRLKFFNRMDNYLVAYFADGRNPYFENITANISGQLLNNRVHWQKLGEILQELNLTDSAVIDEALEKQQQERSADSFSYYPSDEEGIGDRLIKWIRLGNTGQNRLGDILIKTRSIDPPELRTGLISQLLPNELTKKLSNSELLTLLQISVLALNLHKNSLLVSQIIEMAVQLLRGEAGSLMLANRQKNEVIIAVHYGSHREELEGRVLPLDKGLAGWVFHHGKAAFVINSSSEGLSLGNSSADGDEIHTILAVPLHINGEIIGVTEIINKKQGNFTNHDADILTLISNIIAPVLALASEKKHFS